MVEIKTIPTYKFHADGTQPNSREIFVFGSNKAGIHGAGAARQAEIAYGARRGVGWGFSGRTYAIPTKDFQINSMDLDEIEHFVKLFVNETYKHSKESFFVTRVGCGLAGYKDADIAPFFKGCNINCSFAKEWMPFLK